VTTEPSLVALMVDALALRGTERMLEVGAGYG
jgi:protein-L-isoaspartate O-methyltransferase